MGSAKTMRLGRLLFAFATALVLAGGSAERGALAGDCFEGISEANAKSVFDTLAATRGDCALEGVQTQKSLMKIRWKKAGQSLEDVLVAPSSCVKQPSVRGKLLSTVVPRSVADACGSQVDALNALVLGNTFGGLVPVTGAIPLPELAGPAPRPWIRRHWLPVAAAAAGFGVLVAGIVVGIKRRRATRRPPAAAGG